MLLFKKKFMDAIRAGEKTQTIRLWNHCRMRAGQRSYIPGAGYIRVLSIEPIDVSELTDADAVPDGFESAEKLRAELNTLYAEQLASGYQAYRICFELMSAEEQQQARAERQEKKRLAKTPATD
jgi:hypothetical protein